MPQDDWDHVSREVVSVFTALTGHPPIFMICLDWDLVCRDFDEEDNWTK